MSQHSHRIGRTGLPVFALVTFLAGCGGGGGESAAPPAPPAPPTAAELNAASRFLSQATFGMPFEAVDAVARQGHAAWLDAQFNLPASLHEPLIDDFVARRDGGDFSAFESDIEFLVFFRRLAWWHQTVTAADVLRQRVAFALSEIFVVSDNTDALAVNPYALSTYYDTLQRNAFGNFRDLLSDVSRHAAMGIFLSHVNNRRSDPVNNTFPDENYAREVMQLFTIGLFELNDDGSLKSGPRGAPIPTYSNTEIREFAKIFTGFSYGGAGSFFGRPNPYYRAPMEMFDAAHEPGEKRLLNGMVVPAGQSGLEDFEMAMDNLFDHPNVGPFIGKQLIQRLVMSNPSPAYIERVARAFNDNGAGVRGDMRAVIRAVLLDSESSNAGGATGGKLREPVVRYTSILRQLGAESADGFIANLGYYLGAVGRQHPLSSPSVFNFFLPAHAPPGAIADAGLVAPEFQILNANSVVNFANLVDAALFGDFATDAPAPFEEVSLNLTPLTDIADDAAALVDRLDLMFTFGAMEPATRTVILDTIEPISDADFRVRAALYLVLVSPDYAVRY